MVLTAVNGFFRWLIFGCICCCCTAGCSLLPVVCLNKRVLQSINKLLDWENNRLYCRLGFSWKIEQQRFEHFNEYVLVLEELPKVHVYKPD
ncbi:cysteine-rich hydrophobic domain-containing protein 1-like isoform X2 [Agrilus planipennis]|uniref:Cysteine-rich hydrophobic domain-containing protein 1-like isoform X2 n=1 Tax=Agrilus planipennis TaxID=224129 RepID=A0A7F5R8P0_AGRPL|nr:cysteine-rich hydrophobic domain-containing protein 1-like isoform X2 [Agrilus planipennis]